MRTSDFTLKALLHVPVSYGQTGRTAIVYVQAGACNNDLAVGKLAYMRSNGIWLRLNSAVWSLYIRLMIQEPLDLCFEKLV